MGRGRFITFEGGEGSGKSTQCRRLAQRLADAGIEAIPTREPGGTPGGDDIRALLVEGEAGRWDAKSEALLHFAARREHVTRMIEPALAAGRWVVCDRFTDSSMAYQGYGHGLGADYIQALAELTIGDFRPELTLILDIDPQIGLKRAGRRGGNETRYEAMEIEFHQRLRAGFLKIAEAEPGRCVVIAATGSEEQIAEAVWRAVREMKGASDVLG
ncbi:MAG: dTMP kinase [Alphaproteobacteria bacterium]